MDTYRNYIGGQWAESNSQRTTPNVNPANTDDILGIIRQATREEARQAVESAAGAFPGLARYSGARAREDRSSGRTFIGRQQGTAGADPDSRGR